MKKVKMFLALLLTSSFCFSQLPSVLAMRSDYHKLGKYGEGVDTVHYDYVNNYDVDFLFTKDTIFLYDKNGLTINLTSIGYLEQFTLNESKFIILFCKNENLGKEGQNCRFIFATDTVEHKNTAVYTNLDTVVYFNISKVVSLDDNAINYLVATLPKLKYEK